MSYPDTLSRLEGQIRQLEEARMQEARERDSLRSEVNRLRAENDRFRSALEVIAGSSDKLQATQALGALSNIGAAVR